MSVRQILSFIHSSTHPFIPSNCVQHLSQEKTLKAIHKIRAAVIGCGGMGSHHVKTLAAHPAFDLVAGCDVNPAALGNLPPAAARYADAAEMFEKHKLDLVSLILPNHLYEPMVKLAAAHGACVFTEKPFGHTLASCRAMIATLRAAGLRGWVGAQRKYAAHFREARGLLRDMPLDFVNVVFTYFWGPAFGDPGWRGDRARSGGVAVIDSGWHVLDALSWLVGDPDTVVCQLGFLESHPDIDDKAVIQFRYPSGAIGSVVISYTLPRSAMELTFAAGRRSVYLDYNALVAYSDARETQRIEAAKDEPIFTAMYDELAMAFGGDESAYVTDLARAERIMKTVDACYRSAQEGGAVKSV